MPAKKCEWKAMEQLPVEFDLGREFQFHSIFICPVLKEPVHALIQPCWCLVDVFCAAILYWSCRWVELANSNAFSAHKKLLLLSAGNHFFDCVSLSLNFASRKLWQLHNDGKKSHVSCGGVKMKIFSSWICRLQGTVLYGELFIHAGGILTPTERTIVTSKGSDLGTDAFFVCIDGKHSCGKVSQWWIWICWKELYHLFLAGGYTGHVFYWNVCEYRWVLRSLHADKLDCGDLIRSLSSVQMRYCNSGLEKREPWKYWGPGNSWYSVAKTMPKMLTDWNQANKFSYVNATFFFKIISFQTWN